MLRLRLIDDENLVETAQLINDDGKTVAVGQVVSHADERLIQRGHIETGLIFVGEVTR